jgi:serine/threonine protein kinase
MAEPRRGYELARGESVGKYEVLRKLAAGGMAELYLARVRGAAGFEKVVVLKRILPGVAEDPAFVQMFLDEARLAATLQHPNIADVYDVGEVDGQYFFTMEFVYGQDARTIRHEMARRNEPVPLAASLAIVHGAASALDYAHERRGTDGALLGLVHRDVSASNVMVSYDGAVKLLDFGIARVKTATHRTQVGTLKGKVPYMSPEQCKGLPLDRRSDLFSLGVVLFELTVGRRPFRGDSDYVVMDQIVHQGAPRPSSLVSGYPAELEAIVMRLLEREPKARYTTADELVDDLDAFMQANGLWLSPKQLGKYMRTVFADRMKAREEAAKQGVSFTEHVADAITSESQQSELLTPPAALRPSSPEIVAALRPTPPVIEAAQLAAEPPSRTGEGWEVPTTSFRTPSTAMGDVGVVRSLAALPLRAPPPGMTPPIGVPATYAPTARGTPTPPAIARTPSDTFTPPTIPDTSHARGLVPGPPPPATAFDRHDASATFGAPAFMPPSEADPVPSFTPVSGSEPVPSLRPRSTGIALAVIAAVVLGAIILALAMV